MKIIVTDKQSDSSHRRAYLDFVVPLPFKSTNTFFQIFECSLVKVSVEATTARYFRNPKDLLRRIPFGCIFDLISKTLKRLHVAEENGGFLRSNLKMTYLNQTNFVESIYNDKVNRTSIIVNNSFQNFYLHLVCKNCK